jgi:hypothetical protein
MGVNGEVGIGDMGMGERGRCTGVLGRVNGEGERVREAKMRGVRMGDFGREEVLGDIGREEMTGDFGRDEVGDFGVMGRMAVGVCGRLREGGLLD